MENKKRTTLQELIAWGDEMLLKHPHKTLSFGEAIDKAVELLEKEKEQIIKAHGNKKVKSAGVSNCMEILTGERYYNDTYTND